MEIKPGRASLGRADPIADLRRDLAGAWRSPRLEYRPLSSRCDEDVAFLEHMNADPVTLGMGGGALLRPPPRETALHLAALLEKSYLAVMIYAQVPPLSLSSSLSSSTTSSTTTSAAADADAGTEDKEKDKWRRIGFVSLGLGGDDPIYPLNFSGSQKVAISLAAAAQGHGYGTEAMRWLLWWAFRFGNLHRVELATLAYNGAARTVYERVGFVREGRQREVTFAGGRYWDLVLYAVLRREWEEGGGREAEAEAEATAAMKRGETEEEEEEEEEEKKKKKQTKTKMDG